jgi:hypothetical protein
MKIKVAPLHNISYYIVEDMGFHENVLDWIREVYDYNHQKNKLITVQEISDVIDQEDDPDTAAILKLYHPEDKVSLYGELHKFW